MGKIAFIFPGQGAQKPCMGKDLYETNQTAKQIFDTAGTHIKHLCFDESQEELNKTQNAQPSIFTVDLAVAYALKNAGINPDVVAGFSLGEIPALTFAGAFSLEEGLEFVGFRGESMAKCAQETSGEMYAILRLDENAVEEICDKIAFPVNYNCPSQTVVAVKSQNANELLSRTKLAGGRAMKLQVSGAFHSPYMDKASEEISEYISTHQPKECNIPVYSNVTAKPYDDFSLISTQVNSPVRWQKTIENMIADGVDTFIETGVGTVLSGLIKKVSSTVKVYSVSDSQSLQNVMEELK